MSIQSVLAIAPSLIGDGVSKSFTFDITKGPFNVNVGGNNPVGAQLEGGPSGATVSLSGTKITLEFLNASDLPTPGMNPISFAVLILFPGN